MGHTLLFAIVLARVWSLALAQRNVLRRIFPTKLCGYFLKVTATLFALKKQDSVRLL
jgi:hypothetical protein